MADHPTTETKPHRTGHNTGASFNPKTRPVPKQPSKPKYT